MQDIRTEKIIFITAIMNIYDYAKNEIINRRINSYDFRENTTIRYSDKHIKISTETCIAGVHNVLFLFSNGVSKLCFEFK